LSMQQQNRVGVLLDLSALTELGHRRAPHLAALLRFAVQLAKRQHGARVAPCDRLECLGLATAELGRVLASFFLFAKVAEMIEHEKVDRAFSSRPAGHKLAE